MKSRQQMTEPGLSPRSGLAGRTFHTLARFFNGIHWAMGITTLPRTATAREERSFVLMWLGIIVFMVVFFAAFIYVLGRI